MEDEPLLAKRLRRGLVLDLMLPDGSGLELLHQWRNNGVAVPVLILDAALGGWRPDHLEA